MIGTRESPIVIYTDGSCRNFTGTKRRTNGHGGWAFVVVNPDGNTYRSGFLPAPQTNNTAEIWAVLEAMRWVVRNGLQDQYILIRPDSTYVINGMISAWIHVAAETNFRGEKNGNLWRRLYQRLNQIRRLNFLHVKGHAGDKYNEFCDRIASRARKQGEMKLRRAK